MKKDFEYNFSAVKDDKKARGCLFGCHTLSGVVNIFISTFLMAYIYTFDGGIYNYIYNVGLFNCVSYGLMVIGFLSIAPIVDKTNRIWVYRIALVLRTVLVILVLFWGKELANLLVLAAVLNGISDTCYYASYNVLKQEMVSRKNMRNYSVSTNVIAKVVEVVCPIVLGALIDVTTYSQVAIIIFVVCVAQIVLSFGVNAKKPKGSNFNLLNYFKKLKQKPVAFKKIMLIYLVTALYSATTMTTIMLNICIMMQFGSNFSLGAITSIFSAVAIVGILFFNRFTKPGRRSCVYLVLSVLPLLASIVLAFSITKATIILFNLALAVPLMVFKTVYDVYRNGTLKEAGLYSGICEHQAMIEVIMDISRAIYFGGMFLISLINSMFAFKLLLVLTCALFAIQFLLILVYEKRFHKKDAMTVEELEEERFAKIMKILLTKENN